MELGWVLFKTVWPEPQESTESLEALIPHPEFIRDSGQFGRRFAYRPKRSRCRVHLWQRRSQLLAQPHGNPHTNRRATQGDTGQPAKPTSQKNVTAPEDGKRVWVTKAEDKIGLAYAYKHSFLHAEMISQDEILVIFGCKTARICYFSWLCSLTRLCRWLGWDSSAPGFPSQCSVSLEVGLDWEVREFFAPGPRVSVSLQCSRSVQLATAFRSKEVWGSGAFPVAAGFSSEMRQKPPDLQSLHWKPTLPNLCPFHWSRGILRPTSRGGWSICTFEEKRNDSCHLWVLSKATETRVLKAVFWRWCDYYTFIDV